MARQEKSRKSDKGPKALRKSYSNKENAEAAARNCAQLIKKSVRVCGPNDKGRFFLQTQ